MALTTVKPSPASGICRSESNTSKLSAAMRLSASHTFATPTTSKPSRSSDVRNISRTASSSSASKTLGIPELLSAPATHGLIYCPDNIEGASACLFKTAHLLRRELPQLVRRLVAAREDSGRTGNGKCLQRALEGRQRLAVDLF